jgi:NAD(P)-dependent dehydrogenase (short-subunit alcohol dehydrogenase family)
MAADLEGRVAIVTGSGLVGAIGWETARALAELGARVVLADVPGSKLEEAVQELKTAGHDVVGRNVDISDEAQVSALIQFTTGHFGTLDIVDNNAAATYLTPQDVEVVNASAEVWDATMAVNVRGTMLMCKHSLPTMLAKGRGSIVNIVSDLALTGDIANVAYSASKAAVGSLTRHIATMYGNRGVRCNAVAPGLTNTPQMGKSLTPEFAKMIEDSCVISRLGASVDIANMAAFLATDRAAYITGQTISVDGGLLMHLPATTAMLKLIAAGPAT